MSSTSGTPQSQDDTNTCELKNIDSKNEQKEKGAKLKGNEEESSDDEGLLGASPGECDAAEGDDCSTEEEEEKAWLEKLQDFFASKLKLKEEEAEPQVLDEASIDGIVSYIKSGKCKNIITMAGAGISTSAGIPDFRSPDSGLYSNLGKYNLPHPQAIFDIEFFKKNPKPFFVLAKELYPGAFNPTPCHHFIKLLCDKDLLLRHYTQNIDTLEHVAGIYPEKIVEAHGTFRSSHCLSCDKAYDQDWMKDEIFADNIPTCTECSGVVKPDIVFFGENLPRRFFQLMQTDFMRCDLLIILGTSLAVQPFASLIDNVPPSCPRLLINREKVGQSNTMMAAFQGLFGKGVGLQFGKVNNTRDVPLIGDCDDGCRILAEKLGWKDDLELLIGNKSSNL